MDITLIRSGRRSLAVEIRPDGAVVVRAPYAASRGSIDRFLRQHADWIEAHRAAVLARQPDPADLLTEPELAALKAAAREDFAARAARFAPLVGVDYAHVTVRCQRSKWGSCSSRGNLSFNCLLMLAPEAVRDYVTVHELCHRLEMNHSPRFWAQVGRVLPDYAAARRWLKTEGGALLARIGPK